MDIGERVRHAYYGGIAIGAMVMAAVQTAGRPVGSAVGLAVGIFVFVLGHRYIQHRYGDERKG